MAPDLAIKSSGWEEGIKVGREEGEKLGRLATAKNMLKNNVDIDLISELTGLEVEEIKSLQTIYGN